jgi:transposase
MLCRLHLDHIGYLDKTIAELDARVEAMMVPFRAARDLLITVPGIAAGSAAAVISEISPAPLDYFPTAGHLASWAGICPGNHESAGRHGYGNGATATPACSPSWSRSPGPPSATRAT